MGGGGGQFLNKLSVFHVANYIPCNISKSMHLNRSGETIQNLPLWSLHCAKIKLTNMIFIFITVRYFIQYIVHNITAYFCLMNVNF